MTTPATRRPAGPVQLARVAVVTCTCRRFPLGEAMHRTPAQAWTAASRHAALNPQHCRPAMAWDTVPAGLAARLPRA